MPRIELSEYLSYIPVLESLFPDYRVAGLDPGFLFFSRNERFHDSFTLPYRAGKALYERFKPNSDAPQTPAV